MCEQPRVRETFGKYIDPRVVEGLIDRPTLTAAEGQRRVMTVLFCDLKGFTSLSEGMTPQGLVKVMNRYLSIMSEPIRTNRGIIDKYIGDGIMAYWGPPFVDEADHARFACFAAMEMIERIATLRQEIPELLGVRGTPMEKCDLRIGVATGEALVGSIGSDVMMSYTVMGDVVNLASRLEGVNKTYGTRNLVSERTIAAAGAALEVREIDRVVVAGHTHSEIIFEILGRKGELTPQQFISRDKYLEGLAAYREQRWDEALRALNESLGAIPDDGPSMALLKRVESLKANLPSRDWDGAWHIDKKLPRRLSMGQRRLWVIRVVLTVGQPLPVAPDKQTFSGSVCMSQRGTKGDIVSYSITSSARRRIDGGMVRPSALAVLRLTPSSNLIGCCTGRSAGFAPLMILST